MEGRIKSLINSNLQLVKVSLWGVDAPGAEGEEGEPSDGIGKFDYLTQRAGFAAAERTKWPAERKGSRAQQMCR